MTTRCLRLRSPIVHFLRYASNVASSTPTQQAAADPVSRQRAQATLEPSSIFGSVKRAPKEPLSKSIPTDMKMSKPSLKTKKAKREEPKKPLTEAEKMVVPSPDLVDIAVCV